MPADANQCQQQLFAGTHKARMQWCAASEGSRSWYRTDPGYMHKLHQRPAVAHALQGAPIGIVAKIGAGIARQASRQSGSSQRGEKARERRIARQRAYLSGLNRPVIGTVTVRIRKHDRPRIAGARLDANLSPAAGKTEDQQHVGLLRQQFGQIAVDRVIGRREDMAGETDSGERRAPPACESRGQTSAGV